MVSVGDSRFLLNDSTSITKINIPRLLNKNCSHIQQGLECNLKPVVGVRLSHRKSGNLQRNEQICPKDVNANHNKEYGMACCF